MHLRRILFAPPGALAQLEERRLCKAEVTGSRPVRSIYPAGRARNAAAIDTAAASTRRMAGPRSTRTAPAVHAAANSAALNPPSGPMAIATRSAVHVAVDTPP